MTIVFTSNSLADWLAYQERTHPNAIELGLDRTRVVALRLGLLPAQAVTLTVAGTNGKGSSVTLAAGIYQAAGYRVGRFTSPHLLCYNERVAIDGVEVSDEALCRAFAAIEVARAEIPLTYFEFGTLAALWLFHEAAVDVQVLEVGLGGRLDAVNIVDADCALVTNIGLDHTDWLGPDRDSIGFEKAGIMRGGKPAVYADDSPPRRLLEHAAAIGAPLALAGRDFSFSLNADRGWNWRGGVAYSGLPAPALSGEAQYRNAAGVLAAVTALQALLPVSEEAIRAALPAMALAGRYQRVGNTILDVTHNVESAEVLADNLRGQGGAGRTWLVLGMLADKPVEAVCAVLAPLVQGAVFGGLPPPRGLAGVALQQRAAVVGLNGQAVSDIAEAYRVAQSLAGPDDRILVCGSFLTVAAVASLLF
ncbi:MAG: bifunctional tetrahydrofolate synthase/dihydrofolate synthase [Nevskia sp.]|nr:bifunctional tetrahydrofolate synthase/dihydrofolate synthase [Nevskia sp.]